MLKKLVVKNFTIIDELSVDFGHGLNIITGETGAGKSILIDAIDIALGARTNKEQIKTGEEKAVIELTIEVSKHFPTEILEKHGIDLIDNSLIFTKEILSTSSRSRINGVMVAQNAVSEVREHLLDIHSQHQTYALINPKLHLEILDNYGVDGHRNLLEEFKILYKKYQENIAIAQKIKQQGQNFEQQVDFLKFQINEIKNANIENVEEYDELVNCREILVNAEELKSLAYGAYFALYEQEQSIIDSINIIASSVNKALELDSSLEEPVNSLSEIKFNLKETANFLRNYSEKLEVDKQELLNVEERIDMLQKLKRKYGGTLESILENLEKFEKELEEIGFSTGNLENIEAEIVEIKNKLDEKACLLTKYRIEIAKTLSLSITEEIRKLEMPYSEFKINVQNAEMTLTGSDSVEFFIITNSGEDFKPLSKIASGGEVSRVMLAIKTIFAKSDNIETIIFDEIDTGISGKTSQAVANELSELSKTHQIVCITHQPIIAATSDVHFYVSKEQNLLTTKISVNKLNEKQKLETIANMASGGVSEDSINFAKELIKNSK